MPLGAGLYYNSTTARAAVTTANRLLGRVITYATASGVWVTEKFIGADVVNWNVSGNWDRVPYNSQIVQLGAEMNENIEPSLAEILNAMAGRIIALKSIIKNSVYKNMQVDTLDIVKGFSIYGSTNLVLTGTAAPSVVPDFVGQFYVNTTGGVC